MDQKKLLELQSYRGTKAIGTDTTVRSLDAVISECRKSIEQNASKYRDLKPQEKKEEIKNIIVDYLMDAKPLVEGFITDSGPDLMKLIDRVVADITDYGILTQAMMDESIYEIRCNGKEIKVEKDSRIQDLTDKDGNIISFESTEQQDIILRKMLGDVRLTPKDAVVNARTIEGYRIAAVHYTALGRDPQDFTGQQYSAFVLRKFKESKMELPQIVKFGTMSDNMARLFTVCTEGGLTFVTCGPTASGKTTTNNAALQSVPDNLRVVLLQNPSEIDLRKRDSSGRVYNDVLHLESKEIENPTPTDPTTINLMNHILRLSPVLVCFGEYRTNKEFALGMIILQAGHPVNATYHAEDSEGAMQRFLTAYMAESGETIYTALNSLASKINIIVIQKILRDGRRKVIQMTEVLGVDPENPNKALLNDLYRFIPNGDPVYDANGRVIEIPGEHKRVGKLSKKTMDKLAMEGIPKKRFDFLLKEVDENEVETYTGDNITTYGKVIGGK